jgi:hypothetical protein
MQGELHATASGTRPETWPVTSAQAVQALQGDVLFQVDAAVASAETLRARKAAWERLLKALREAVFGRSSDASACGSREPLAT